MRLFVGLCPSPEFRSALAEMQEYLRNAGITGRYLEPANLHMTLAFIGEWPEDVTELLPEVTCPFSVTLAHPGVFPRAKVLWAGVEKCEALDSLAALVRQRLSEADVPFDPQAFAPHITLARKPLIPEGLDLSALPVPHARMEVREVCLYRSEHGLNGMEYTVIGRSGR